MRHLLLKPISNHDFERQLRAQGHEIPDEDPDFYAPLAQELAAPFTGDDVEIDLRVSKPLRCGADYWDGHRNPSGQPHIEGKVYSGPRHHSHKLRK